MITRFIAADSECHCHTGREYTAMLLNMYPIRSYPDADIAWKDDPRFRIYRDYSRGELVNCISCVLDDGTEWGHYIWAECGTRETALRIYRQWLEISEGRGTGLWNKNCRGRLLPAQRSRR